MFPLSVVKAALLASATALQQVILPEGAGSSAVDTAALLKSLVEGQLGYGPDPLVLGGAPSYPAAIYKLDGSQALDFGTGYPVLREDSYLLALAAPTYGDMWDAAEAVKAALLAYTQTSGAGTATLLDQADERQTDRDAPMDLYKTGILLAFTHLALASQAVPAAFVYLDSHGISPSRKYKGMTITDEETRFSVLLVARVPTGGDSALATTVGQIQSAVMAIDQSGWRRPLCYGGTKVAVHNSLILWRESFGVQRQREFT